MTGFMATGKIVSVSAAYTAAANTVRAGIVGKRIRLIGGMLNAGAAGCTFKWQDGAVDDLSGSITVAANGAILDKEVPGGLVETTDGKALIMNISAGAANGIIKVQEIRA